MTLAPVSGRRGGILDGLFEQLGNADPWFVSRNKPRPVLAAGADVDVVTDLVIVAIDGGVLSERLGRR